MQRTCSSIKTLLALRPLPAAALQQALQFGWWGAGIWTTVEGEKGHAASTSGRSDSEFRGAGRRGGVWHGATHARHATAALSGGCGAALASSFATQTRGYARPREYPLPEGIAELVEAYRNQPKPEAAPVPPLEPRVLTFDSRRAGLIAIKAAMTQEWDEWGARVPLTVLWVDDCEVRVRAVRRAQGRSNHGLWGRMGSRSMPGGSTLEWKGGRGV